MNVTGMYGEGMERIYVKQLRTIASIDDHTDGNNRSNKRNRTINSCDDDDENGDDGDDDDGDDDETGDDDDEIENRDDDDRNDDDDDSYCTIIIRMLKTLNTYAYLQPFARQGNVLDAQKLFSTKHRSIDLTASGPIT